MVYPPQSIQQSRMSSTVKLFTSMTTTTTTATNCVSNVSIEDCPLLSFTSVEDRPSTTTTTTTEGGGLRIKGTSVYRLSAPSTPTSSSGRSPTLLFTKFSCGSSPSFLPLTTTKHSSQGDLSSSLSPPTPSPSSPTSPTPPSAYRRYYHSGSARLNLSIPNFAASTFSSRDDIAPLPPPPLSEQARSRSFGSRPKSPRHFPPKPPPEPYRYPIGVVRDELTKGKENAYFSTPFCLARFIPFRKNPQRMETALMKWPPSNSTNTDTPCTTATAANPTTPPSYYYYCVQQRCESQTRDSMSLRYEKWWLKPVRRVLSAIQMRPKGFPTLDPSTGGSGYTGRGCRNNSGNTSGSCSCGNDNHDDGRNSHVGSMDSSAAGMEGQEPTFGIHNTPGYSNTTSCQPTNRSNINVAPVGTTTTSSYSTHPTNSSREKSSNHVNSSTVSGGSIRAANVPKEQQASGSKRLSSPVSGATQGAIPTDLPKPNTVKKAVDSGTNNSRASSNNGARLPSCRKGGCRRTVANRKSSTDRASWFTHALCNLPFFCFGNCFNPNKYVLKHSTTTTTAIPKTSYPPSRCFRNMKISKTGFGNSIRRCNGRLEGLQVDTYKKLGRVHFGCIWDIYDRTDTILGTGFSGPVRLIQSKHTGKTFAVKSFCKKGASAESLELLLNEARICLAMDHPNIARLVDLYESRDEVHLVMEHCSGRQLYERLARAKHYVEAMAATAAKQMTQALSYLHSHNVIHRDIKLENWLYENEEEDAKLKLIDFGFSKIWKKHASEARAVVGTIYYIAPEALHYAEYTTAVDLWSLGVVVYMMLSGHPPFYGKTRRHTVKQILHAKVHTDDDVWNSVSPQAKDFVKRCLCASPVKRITAAEALRHPWLAQRVRISKQPIDPTVLEGIMRFAQFHQLKRAALTVLAYALTSDEIGAIRDIFLSFDTSGRGVISLADFTFLLRQSFSYLSVAEIEQLFGCMDISSPDHEHGRHEIEYTQFIAAVLQTRIHMHKGIIRRAFEKFDIEGLGYVTIRQLKEALGGTFSAAQLREAVSALDLDGNGRISYDEFIQFIQDEGQGTGEQSKKCLMSTLALLDRGLHELSTGHSVSASNTCPSTPCATRSADSLSSSAVAFSSSAGVFRHPHYGSHSLYNHSFITAALQKALLSLKLRFLDRASSTISTTPERTPRASPPPTPQCTLKHEPSGSGQRLHPGKVGLDPHAGMPGRRPDIPGVEDQPTEIPPEIGMKSNNQVSFVPDYSARQSPAAHTFSARNKHDGPTTSCSLSFTTFHHPPQPPSSPSSSSISSAASGRDDDSPLNLPLPASAAYAERICHPLRR